MTVQPHNVNTRWKWDGRSLLFVDCTNIHPTSLGMRPAQPPSPANPLAAYWGSMGNTKHSQMGPLGLVTGSWSLPSDGRLLRPLKCGELLSPEPVGTVVFHS